MSKKKPWTPRHVPGDLVVVERGAMLCSILDNTERWLEHQKLALVIGTKLVRICEDVDGRTGNIVTVFIPDDGMWDVSSWRLSSTIGDTVNDTTLWYTVLQNS